MHVYSDATGQKAVIVIVGDDTSEDWPSCPNVWKISSAAAILSCRS